MENQQILKFDENKEGNTKKGNKKDNSDNKINIIDNSNDIKNNMKINSNDNDKTFNKICKLQKLIKKQAALKELCK